MYKLLIVDDEQIEREGMAHFIQWDKYDIQLCGTAWNGADALGKIQKDVPDIVLTDIKMPVMNGIELIQKLSETYRNIVVVVLSGYGEYEFTSQAMEYGIRHYILKPCDEDKIVAVMNDAKKEVDKRREYHTLKRELLPHAKEELFRRLLTGSRLSDDEIMALKKDFPANGDSYRLLAMKNEVSGFEYIEQFILGNILGEILQMATMPLFTYVDDNPNIIVRYNSKLKVFAYQSLSLLIIALIDMVVLYAVGIISSYVILGVYDNWQVDGSYFFNKVTRKGLSTDICVNDVVICSMFIVRKTVIVWVVGMVSLIIEYITDWIRVAVFGAVFIYGVSLVSHISICRLDLNILDLYNMPHTVMNTVLIILVNLILLAVGLVLSRRRQYYR